MPKGGARNRSGPQPDPTSARSERRGIKLTALPREGFDGDAPDFPLPDGSARELAVWATAWRTPQAAAWDLEPWRHRTVALWVRWSVRMEDHDAPAAIGATVIRLADQIGLTPAGLRENGWSLAADEVSAHRPAEPAAPEGPRPRRLRAVGDEQ